MSRKEKISNLQKERLRKTWEGVDFLFIDEISLVGCRFLNQINNTLSIAKENTTDFGGINIIFAGDFAQLPPVGDAPLYTGERKFDGANASSSTQSGQNRASGRLAWLNVNMCVLLHRQMRQVGSANENFRKVLDQLRIGSCSENDCQTFEDRELSKLDTNEIDKFQNAPIITTSNAVKDALNSKCAEKFAKECNLQLNNYHAIDHWTTNKQVSKSIQKYLLTLHSGKTK